MRIVLDIEADGLAVDKIANLWCIVCKDIDNDELFVFKGEDLQSRFSVFAKDITEVIGHNIIQYDLPVISRLLGISFEHDTSVFDTLVVSRLLNVGRPDGHSLESWGIRLKFPKGNHVDFTKYSDEMLEYCIKDVRLNERVYRELTKVLERNKGCFDKALKCEHDIQRICVDMSSNGFKFNRDEAERIRSELETAIKALDEKILSCFPPTIKRTQLKTKVKETIVHFNPNSPKQIIDKLWEAGWKPVDKTKGNKKNEDPEKDEKFNRYGWVLNETNLATLPETCPEGLKVLVERRLLQARINTLNEWLGCYDANTGRIHGSFNPLGARSHRCTHSNPNMGNVATKKTIKYNSKKLRDIAVDLGGRMRSLWICDDDSFLVGCDMESAHLRIFAHMINDKAFTEALINGKKEDSSDPHSVNKRILGEVCVDRDRAKTFIFSFLNGASAPKVSEIFNCSLKAAKDSLSEFVRSYPGLDNLKRHVFPRDADRGYFIGIDGRKIVCDSAHLMMGMYLQSTESILMKYANIMWRKKLDEEGIKYRQVNWVHDEWVTEVLGTSDDARNVGIIQAEAIKRVGEIFNLRCPMGGEYKVGKTWLEVH